MSLESRIDLAVQRSNRGIGRCGPIASWAWIGRDIARRRSRWARDWGLTNDEITVLCALVGDHLDIADVLIIEASVAECLTSNSEYIRERKKLFLKEGV